MKNVFLSVIPGISYASLIDGMTGINFQVFVALILLGTLSFSILLKTLELPNSEI